jgi:uncharacterized protein
MAALLRHLHRWCMGLVLGTTALLALAQSPLEVPTLSARVMDHTATLTEAQRLALDNKLAALEAAAGAQLVVLIVPTTAPEDIASYANRVGNAWKIGRKDVGDGLLLVVAKNDRKLRIEVAKTLEGAVPDVAAKHVIDELITPRFKQGDFAGGLDAGAERLMQLVQKEASQLEPSAFQAAQNSAAHNAADVDAAKGRYLMTLLGIFVFFSMLLGPAASGVVTCVFGGMGYTMALLATQIDYTGATWYWSAVIGPSALALLGFIVLLLLPSTPKHQAAHTAPRKTESTDNGTSWWTSSSSSSSGGSSFSSGGGGDFGGGGASGDW